MPKPLKDLVSYCKAWLKELRSMPKADRQHVYDHPNGRHAKALTKRVNQCLTRLKH
jgi:hypothetical protein